MSIIVSECSFISKEIMRTASDTADGRSEFANENLVFYVSESVSLHNIAC